jgi:hypothetical protein
LRKLSSTVNTKLKSKERPSEILTLVSFLLNKYHWKVPSGGAPRPVGARGGRAKTRRFSRVQRCGIPLFAGVSRTDCGPAPSRTAVRGGPQGPPEGPGPSGGAPRPVRARGGRAKTRRFGQVLYIPFPPFRPPYEQDQANTDLIPKP